MVQNHCRGRQIGPAQILRKRADPPVSLSRITAGKYGKLLRRGRKLSGQMRQGILNSRQAGKIVSSFHLPDIFPLFQQFTAICPGKGRVFPLKYLPGQKAPAAKIPFQQFLRLRLPDRLRDLPSAHLHPPGHGVPLRPLLPIAGCIAGSPGYKIPDRFKGIVYHISLPKQILHILQDSSTVQGRIRCQNMQKAGSSALQHGQNLLLPFR